MDERPVARGAAAPTRAVVAIESKSVAATRRADVKLTDGDSGVSAELLAKNDAVAGVGSVAVVHQTLGVGVHERAGPAEA